MKQYQILSQADLPLRMKQIFIDYQLAYKMCCDWNSSHPVQQMAYVVQLTPLEK